MTDLETAADVIDQQVVESPQIIGKECIICRRILAFNFFKRDSSYRDGRRDICDVCASAPRLSTEEHLFRLRESNYCSEGVKRQRWANQEDYEDSVARIGKPMHSSDFLSIIRRIVPSLYLKDGRIIGDIALFETDDCKHEEWGERDYRYLGYCPTGWLPEYSQYEFDTLRDIPIREKQRGWRTVLLRLIDSKLLSIADCDSIFGKASGVASVVWYRQVQKYY